MGLIVMWPSRSRSKSMMGLIVMWPGRPRSKFTLMTSQSERHMHRDRRDRRDKRHRCVAATGGMGATHRNMTSDLGSLLFVLLEKGAGVGRSPNLCLRCVTWHTCSHRYVGQVEASFIGLPFGYRSVIVRLSLIVNCIVLCIVTVAFGYRYCGPISLAPLWVGDRL